VAGDHCPKLLEADRLGDVVIHPRAETPLPIAVKGASGDCHNWRVAAVLEFADCPCSLKAVHLRHLTIHQYEAIALFLVEGHGLHSVPGDLYVISEFHERLQHNLLIDVIVLDHQNMDRRVRRSFLFRLWCPHGIAARPLLWKSEHQFNPERGAFSCHAADTHRSVHQFRQLFADRQPEAGSAKTACRR